MLFQCMPFNLPILHFILHAFIYILVDKNYRVICPKLILPSVERKASPQSLTAVEVEQHSQRRLTLIKKTKQHMLTILKFEQKFVSNMWCHRWLTLFCFSCTFPICQQNRLDSLYGDKRRQSGCVLLASVRFTCVDMCGERGCGCLCRAFRKYTLLQYWFPHCWVSF